MTFAAVASSSLEHLFMGQAVFFLQWYPPNILYAHIRGVCLKGVKVTCGIYSCIHFETSFSHSLPRLSLVSPSCDAGGDEGYCVWRFHGSLYDLHAGGPSRGPALIMKPLKPPASATPASHCNQPLPLPRIPEREVQAAAIKSAPL